MKRALISVSNKEGVVEFANGLEKLGYEIISTGGTFKLLKEAGVKVKKVADITGFPEILDGRVKTLHPKIHGGILAKRSKEHLEELDKNDISLIDMVVVNLYPFKETVSKAGVTLDEAIENIDIGGPTMVRAAAKNYQNVIIIVKPEFYWPVLKELQLEGELNEVLRLKLAQEAFTHTAAYDAMISSYLSKLNEDYFPDNLVMAAEKVYNLRYGENPHQKAAFYRNIIPGAVKGLADAKQLNGKELSYNNILDTQAAWDLVKEFKETACVIVKHTNPCGTASADKLVDAFEKAFAADSISGFGGIIALNRPVDKDTAQKMAEPFMEVIIAPAYDEEALNILQQKKNLRLLELAIEPYQEYITRSVEGAYLVQENDQDAQDWDTYEIVSERAPNEEEKKQLMLAWKVVKHVKSNAIVIAKDNMTIGVGAGQMNRVGAAGIALAKTDCSGAVMASDAFFPFKDTVELAASHGITAIIQPGGSLKDEESIKACNEKGIAMVFTGIRHFKH